MRNGTLTIQAAVDLVTRIGMGAAELISNQHQGDPVKYGGFEMGQIEAILNLFLAEVLPKDREQVLVDIMRTEKRVIVTIEDAIKILVDRNGRCIPIKPEVSAAVCDANRNYRFDALPTDFLAGSDWSVRWQKLFSQFAGFDEFQFN